MFETSQEEPSSGTGKIIGGVIAVVGVLLVVVYFAFFHSATQTTTTSATANQSAVNTEPADPMKDLAIVGTPNLYRDQATQTMAMWNIQVANRSKSHAYKDIRYATKYFNAQGAVIYQNEGTLKGQVEPSDQQAFTEINDGLYPVGTNNFTIELKGAQPVQ